MPVFPPFLLHCLKIMNGVILWNLILIKTKNINVCCIQIITNHTMTIYFNSIAISYEIQIHGIHDIV